MLKRQVLIEKMTKNIVDFDFGDGDNEKLGTGTDLKNQVCDFKSPDNLSFYFMNFM